MGDEDHCGVERAEPLLEPLEAPHVEMVRRLVEQQEVGIAGERAAQGRAGQLSARESVQLAVEVLVAEAETAKTRCRPLAPVPAAGVLEPSLRVGVAPQRGRIVPALGHGRFERTQFVLQRNQIRGARQRVLAQRQSLLQRRALVVQRDTRALREGDLAAGDARLAGDHAQQRRFPRAVGAGKRDDITALDAERHAVEQRRARELFA